MASKLLLVLDTERICVGCHIDCNPGDCTIGNNSHSCTNCSEVNKYLQNAECVESTSCVNGKIII